MMRKQSIEGRNQFAMFTIDDLVPKDHLVRKIDAAIQFDFIYPIVESTYSTHGRPSIDPVVLIKLVFIQYLFGIRSRILSRISLLLVKTMFEDLEKQLYLKTFSLIF